MTSEPLAREIIGHSLVREQLWACGQEERIPNSLIISGLAGVGKSLVVRAWLQWLTCRETDSRWKTQSEACGRCGSCVRLRVDGTSEHVLRVRPDGGVIKVEQARAVSEFLRLSRWGRYRVVWIEDAHLLNVQAANTLLKSIEEPFPGTFFLLETSQLSQVLPTLRSRSQVLRIGSLSESELRGLLGRSESLAPLFHRLSAADQMAELTSARGQWKRLAESLERRGGENPATAAESESRTISQRVDAWLSAARAGGLFGGYLSGEDGVSLLQQIKDDARDRDSQMTIIRLLLERAIGAMQSETSLDREWGRRLAEVTVNLERDWVSNVDRLLALEEATEELAQ